MNASEKLKINHPKLYMFFCWMILPLALLGVALILAGVFEEIDECLYTGIAMLSGMALVGLICFIQYMANKAKKPKKPSSK